MLKLPRIKQRVMLGVDINTTSIKILELSYRNGQYRVENCIIRSRSSTTRLDARHHQQLLIQELRSLFRSHQFSTRNTAIALSDSQLKMKCIRVQRSLSRNKIKALIDAEIEQIMLKSIDKQEINFYIQDAKKSQSEHLNVVIVAMRSHLMKNQLELLRAVGLRPKIIDVESLAVARGVFHHIKVNATILALIEIQEDQLRFMVFEKKCVIFIYNKTWKPYEKMSLNEILSLLQSVCENFYLSYPNDFIEQFIISGELKLYQDLIEMLAAYFKAPVCSENIFEQVSFSPQTKPPSPGEQAHFSVAYGLALRVGDEY